MGQVTILNGLNVPINSCISAVINYSWCNKLSPKTYYQHNGAASVVTLNVNYWFGEETEFSSNPGEVVTTVLGAVVAAVGVVAVPLTGGGSTALIIAGSAIVAGAGAVVTAVSMGVKDFVNTPCKWTNIHAVQNRKFIAEGTVTLSQSTGPDGSTVVTYTAVPTIKLRELQDDEFRTYITSGGYIEHQAQPLSGGHLTASELGELNLKNAPVKIYPAGGGNCCWEIENDQTNDGAPLQIWQRDVNQVYWILVPVDSADPATNVFYLYNPVLKRYATSGQLIGDRVSASSGHGSAQQFRITRSEDYTEPYFAFRPVQHKDCAIICENGNLGNSTKLLLGAATSVNPMWALWRVTAVNA